MDEMQLIREFGASVMLPDHDDLASARAKLLAEASGPEKATVHPLRGRKRLVWLGATAVGLAAAITAAVALAPVDEVGLPISVPQAQADPVQVLHAAAALARVRPDVEPRPDQFVYTKSQRADGWTMETWASVDGVHDGFEILNGHEIHVAGCRDGKRIMQESSQSGKVVAHSCQPYPAFIPDLPTNADDMLAYLHKSTYGEGDTLHDLGREIIDLSGGYMRPAARAALFEAVAKVPGLTVRQDAKDATGRSVIGISWTTPANGPIGNQDEFLFDPKTFAYLGSGGFGPVVSQGIVDKILQRP
jgi:hypothetical protein